MSRSRRFVPPPHLVEITFRTVLGMYLLRPSERLNEIIIGALGRAQRLYGLRIHAVNYQSNHGHALVSPMHAEQLAQFMNYAQSKIAKEVCRLHDWKDKVWARRYTSIVVTEEEAAQWARVRYVLSNGVKEGLVSSPRLWPGVNGCKALLTGGHLEGLWFNRTKEYATRMRNEPYDELDFAEPEKLVLSPIPCWAHLAPEEYQQRIEEMVEDIEQEAEAKRQRGELPRTPMSRKKILRENPHKRPDHFVPSPAPRVHAATRKARIELLDSYRLFESAFSEAASRLRSGDRSVDFPENSFPPALPFVYPDQVFDPG